MDPLRKLYKRSPRLRRARRRVTNSALLRVTQLALRLGDRMSLEQALRRAEQVGDLLYRALGTPRQLADEHLRIVFGDSLTVAARQQLLRAVFVNVAKSAAELVKMDDVRARAAEYVEFSGWAHVEETLAQGRGFIAITGHLGNWELLAAACAWRGLRVSAVARRIYVPEINRLLVDFRSRQGVETILRESPSSARQILQVIKSNGVLAMLIDQDTNAPSVSVPFLGRTARTPLAAAALALKRDIPVLGVFIRRRPQGGQHVTFTAPFVIERSADLATDIRCLTRQFNARLSQQVLNNPAEWVWWHRRWQHPPQPRLDLDADFEYRPTTTAGAGG